MSVRGFVGLLAVCVFGVVGCGHTAPVVNPAPIAAAPTPDTTEMAILDALPKRRWTAEDVQPGRIVAFLPVKAYLVRVEIVYDERQVRVNYLNSDNLNEHEGADGSLQAHPKVNKWLEVLALDIARSLAAQPGGSAPALATGGELPAEDAAAQPTAPPLLGSALPQGAPAQEAPAKSGGPVAPVPTPPQ